MQQTTLVDHGKASFWVLNPLLLSISYVGVGYLAVLLAIPPGYATTIFPPAGIAIASLLIWGNYLWPGIFFGSLALNILISMMQGTFTASVLVFSLSAATGATLQALAGAWLVKYFIDFPSSLTKARDIFLFMLIAGPLSCLINSSTGAVSLLATGIIQVSDLTYSLFTWWLGDTLGVLVTAPLLFIAFSKPRSLWQNRYASVAAPLTLALAIVLALFFWVSKWEVERSHFEFKEIANNTVEKLHSSLSGYVDAVADIERAYASSTHVTWEEFRTFVQYTLMNKPGINGLSWNPVITQAQRQSFEHQLQAQGFPQFEIKDRDSRGKLITAGNRAEYIVVNYIEPLTKNQRALGFDIASTPSRRQALDQARDTGQPVATSRLTLVQERDQQSGFLLIYPVYSGSHNTVQERRQHITAYAVGVFRVGDIVDAVLSGQYKDQIVVGIYDEAAEKNDHLYGPKDPLNFSKTLLQITDSLEIGGRRWSLHFWPSSQYLATHRTWQAWAVLTSGLLFTAMLGAFLLAMTGRSYVLDSEVKARTKEIKNREQA